MDDILKILLGAALSIAVTFIVEQAKTRRRLWTSARLLLHELQYMQDFMDKQDPKEAISEKRFQTAIDDYKHALFVMSDGPDFTEHFKIYNDLVKLIGSPSPREDDKVRFLLVNDIRRRLGQMLAWHFGPGSSERLGVPESGSPVSYDTRMDHR